MDRTARLPEPSGEATASALIVGAIVQVVSSMGADPQRVLEPIRLDAGQLGDPAVRIPLSLVADAWERAAAATDDPVFGLHFAERAPFGGLDVIDHVVRSAPTVGEAIGRGLRYQRLVHDCPAVELALTTDSARLVHRVEGHHGGAPRHAVEAALAGYVVTGRRVSGVELSPREVTLRHAAPAEASEYQRIFRCPIRFGAPEDTVVLDRALLDLPNGASRPGVQGALDRQVEGILSRLSAAGSLLGRVRAFVAETVREGVPSLGAIARRLHMSPRTLQRRLELDGTSFHALADDVRLERALAYLADPSLPLAEVAFLLGFSAPSAFHRAFRKWTGRTPLQYRRSGLSPHGDERGAPRAVGTSAH